MGPPLSLEDAHGTPVQAAFHVFGMELLAIMDMKATNKFSTNLINLMPCMTPPPPPPSS